ncbi:MAG: hypothetical protein GF308_02400 [Candidatus Heimdallarchaeota archaeon]|nr:hypothetical protein [Candidatus Heimdallarchaeota archaeon]
MNQKNNSVPQWLKFVGGFTLGVVIISVIAFVPWRDITLPWQDVVTSGPGFPSEVTPGKYAVDAQMQVKVVDIGNDYAALIGFEVNFYEYDTFVLIDTVNTDSDGFATAAPDISSGTKVWVVPGDDSMSNTTYLPMPFEVEMLKADSEDATTVYCGRLDYKKTAGTSQLSIEVHRDGSSTAISSWNLTTYGGTGKIFNGDWDIRISSDGYWVRETWDASEALAAGSFSAGIEPFGLYAYFKNQNNTNSAAIDYSGTNYVKVGMPYPYLAVAIHLDEFGYDTNSQGAVIGDNDGLVTKRFSWGFGGCGTGSDSSNSTLWYFWTGVLYGTSADEFCKSGLPAGDNMINVNTGTLPVYK